MIIKKQSLAMFLVSLVVVFSASAEKATTPPIHEFANELKRNIDITRTVPFEQALLVLQQGYEVCTIIEKIEPQVLSQLGVRCETCQNKILSCAEFAGFLLARGARDQLDNFKKLLSNVEVHTINQFMVNIANEQQVNCVVCEKFGHWGELGKKTFIRLQK